MVIPPKDSPATSTSVWRRGWSGATAGIAAGDGGVSGSLARPQTAPSHVLTALGHSEQLAYASGLIGRFNSS